MAQQNQPIRTEYGISQKSWLNRESKAIEREESPVILKPQAKNSFKIREPQKFLIGGST